MTTKWTEEQKQKLMAEDAKVLRHPNRWTSDRLGLKKQPWLTEDGKNSEFGRILASNPLVVDVITSYNGHTGPFSYGSVEELVKVWSLD